MAQTINPEPINPKPVENAKISFSAAEKLFFGTLDSLPLA